MQTIPSNISNRCWTVSNIPQAHESDLSELQIYVNYTNPQGNAGDGCCIDSYVVPLFKLAPRLLEVARRRLVGDITTMGLTPAENNEVKRLCGDHTIPRL